MKLPPSSNSSIYAQITNDIDKSGGNGDNGGILQKLYPCHYCCYQGKSEDEVLRHSVNTHPGLPARPDPSLLELIMKADKKKKEDEKE